jgi:hypothetical protein
VARLRCESHSWRIIYTRVASWQVKFPESPGAVSSLRR